MSFLDFTGLISDDQFEELRKLNLERASSGQQLISLLDVMADDTILENTGVGLTSESSEAVLNEMAAINDASAGLEEVSRFTDQTTNEILQGITQADIEGASVADLTQAYIDGQTNATITLDNGALQIGDLADYGQGSSVVLAPDGKGVIRNGKYTSLDPTQSSMSGSEVNELKARATRNTNLLLAQQELEENGTPIAETLGLKMPGDKGYDGEDRERIQQAENAAEVLLREQSNLDYHKYLEKKSDDGPSAIEIHNQIFGGGGNAPGTVKQDENGNWYAVKQLDNSNALGRDYSIDPKDNSAGPTFGKNVSKDIEEMFPNEVAAAGGSSDFEGSIKDIFKDTDVDSLGYDPVTGTYSTPVVTQTDIAQPGDLDIPEVTTETLDGTPVLTMEEIQKLATEAIDTAPNLTFTPTGGPGTFAPGSLPAAEGDDYTPTSDQLTAQLEEAGLDDLRTDVSDVDFSKTSTGQDFDLASAFDSYDTQGGTSSFIDNEYSTPVADQFGYEDTLLAPGTGGLGADETVGGFTEAGLADEVAKYTGSNVTSDIGSGQDNNPNASTLTAGTIADGLFKDVLAGGAEEGALRVEGTANMVDDVLNILAKKNIIGGSEAVINPEYANNVTALEDLSGLDRLALETRAAELNVPVAFLLDPTISNETGETIPITLATDPNFTVATDSVQGAIKLLNDAEADILKSMDPEYVAAITAGMPDPNNEGYNIAGDRITPGLWMASLAAQELLGLGLDVATVVTLGPVAGGALTLQQGTAEAGQAAANDVTSELTALRESGALDHLTDEQFQNALNTSSTQAFYTSGPIGGIVDTATALTAGGFAPLAKVLPGVIGSVLKGTTVVGAEGLSGAGEQVGVNAAVIRQLEEAGIDLAKYDRGYLDGIITAAINEAVGGTGAATAVTVSSLVSNLSSDNTGTDQAGQGQDNNPNVGSGLGAGQDNNPNVGPDLIASQGLNTIESNDVTDSNGVVYGVDTAVDANGNTSVTVTNKTTNTSKTTNVANGNTNVVSVGSDTSVLVDSTNTNNSNTVNVSTLSPGSSVTIGGGENLLGGDDDTEVLKATGTDDAVAGGNVVNNVDVSGTGITGVIQGGATGDGTSTANLTLVGDSSVNTNGDLTITTVTDANGNATVSTTNNVTGENTITNVVVGDSTSVTNGNTTVNINAETNGTTTQATDNTVTTDNTTTTDNTVTTVTTVEEPDYLPGDTDVTVSPIETVFVPETSFTPGGDDTTTGDDDEVPPVGEQAPGYTSGIAGLSGARPTVAPYYQPQQTGQYSFYVPQPGVDQTVPAGPVMSDPTSYLAPTANPQYGYGYIAPNAELEYLRRLAEIQGTGAEKLPSENLMDGS
jgi:hypothetical protein